MVLLVKKPRLADGAFGSLRWAANLRGFACFFDRRSGVRWVLLAVSVSVAVAVALETGSFDYGAHPVVAVGVDLDAVDLTLEAWEALAELFSGQD